FFEGFLRVAGNRAFAWGGVGVGEAAWRVPASVTRPQTGGESAPAATGMKLDCALAMDALREVPDVASAAEEVGFTRLWANDTKHNPFVTLTMAALHTSRLELGTGVA